MKSKPQTFRQVATLFLWILVAATCLYYLFGSNSKTKITEFRPLASFKKGALQKPYDREKEPFTPIVDTHLHFRPFGGKEIPFNELLDYLQKTSVRFVNVYGIGQRVPINSDCIYYLDCPNTPVLPTIKNDMANAESYIQNNPKRIHLVNAMTFPDLSNPDNILNLMQLYEKEYPGVFLWMGEVNLIKQALLQNMHDLANLEDIEKWGKFMAVLHEKDIPLNIHSDLGNDENPTQFLYLMNAVLTRYPNNKIVWAHMGLSKELTQMDPNLHIQLMTTYLDQHPNLMLDISWDILEKNYFSKYRSLYVAFLNDYSTRILPGSDFVAAAHKDFDTYQKELNSTSMILKHLNDEAFRNIALGENYFRLLHLDYEAPQIAEHSTK